MSSKGMSAPGRSETGSINGVASGSVTRSVYGKARQQVQAIDAKNKPTNDFLNVRLRRQWFGWGLRFTGRMVQAENWR
jgi:hypothetical protein